jgi:integrase
VQALLSQLPEHQVDVVLFALATGLRQSNVINLEWSQDMPRQAAWIHGDQAKGGRDIHVSLNSAAMSVLERQLGKHPYRMGEHEGMAQRACSCRDRGFSLARLASHLGELARTERHTSVCGAGNGCLGV